MGIRELRQDLSRYQREDRDFEPLELDLGHPSALSHALAEVRDDR